MPTRLGDPGGELDGRRRGPDQRTAEDAVLPQEITATEADEPTPPCGACRQFLYEFNPQMTVVSESRNGDRKRWVLSELLLDGFGPDDLAG